jgi:hypothetical protein
VHNFLVFQHSKSKYRIKCVHHSKVQSAVDTAARTGGAHLLVQKQSRRHTLFVFGETIRLEYIADDRLVTHDFLVMSGAWLVLSCSSAPAYTGHY